MISLTCVKPKIKMYLPYKFRKIYVSSVRKAGVSVDVTCPKSSKQNGQSCCDPSGKISRTRRDWISSNSYQSRLHNPSEACVLSDHVFSVLNVLPSLSMCTRLPTGSETPWGQALHLPDRACPRRVSKESTWWWWLRRQCSRSEAQLWPRREPKWSGWAEWVGNKQQTKIQKQKQKTKKSHNNNKKPNENFQKMLKIVFLDLWKAIIGPSRIRW